MNLFKKFVRGFSTLGMAVVFGVFVARAEAATLTYDFVATSFEGGTATGSFSYDTNAPDMDAGPAGEYTGLGFNVSISGGLLDGGSLNVAAPRITMGNAQGFVIFPTASPITFLQLLGNGNVNDEALPGSLDLATFFISNLGLEGVELGLPTIRTQVFYDIESLELRASVVPLPAGLPLLLAGLGVFAVIARKRRSG